MENKGHCFKMKCNRNILEFNIVAEGRVSFYAFINGDAFQVDNANNFEPTNEIPRNSTIQSQNVLSASVVGAVVQNLKQNVTMVFELTMVCR